jgi:hypothetical protein
LKQVLLRGIARCSASEPGCDPTRSATDDEQLHRIGRVVENLKNDAALRQRLPDLVMATELAVEIFDNSRLAYRTPVSTWLSFFRQTM